MRVRINLWRVEVTLGLRLKMKRKKSRRQGELSKPNGRNPRYASYIIYISIKSAAPDGLFFCQIGEGRPDVLIRLCMVVDWCVVTMEKIKEIQCQ